MEWICSGIRQVKNVTEYLLYSYSRIPTAQGQSDMRSAAFATDQRSMFSSSGNKLSFQVVKLFGK